MEAPVSPFIPDYELLRLIGRAISALADRADQFKVRYDRRRLHPSCFFRISTSVFSCLVSRWPIR